MAIEDDKYNLIIRSIDDYMAIPRESLVRTHMLRLAVSILKHYRYEVVIPAADAPKEPA